MLIKMSNGVWLDPTRVTLIQRVSRPQDSPKFPVLVEIRMVDEVAQFLVPDAESAQQFVDSEAEMVNRALAENAP